MLSGTGNVIFNMPFGGAKDIWLSQPVSGTGGITVQGGARALTLTSNNTFSGGITLTNADNKVQILHANALGTGIFRSEPTTANSGQLVCAANLSSGSGVTNAFDIASGAYLNILANGTNHLRLSGPITSAAGTGNLYKAGTAHPHLVRNQHLHRHHHRRRGHARLLQRRLAGTRPGGHHQRCQAQPQFLRHPPGQHA